MKKVFTPDLITRLTRSSFSSNFYFVIFFFLLVFF